MPLTPLQIKIIAGAVGAILVLAALGILAFTAKHYHDLWVDVKTELAAQAVSLQHATVAAVDCSAGTDKLQEAADSKAKDVKAAQSQAAILARNNETLAQSLLNAKPVIIDNACQSSIELFKKYKADSDPLVKNEGASK